MFVKRLLDIFLSGAAIVALSPLLLALSACELAFHGRPILFAQERPGLHGKIFRIYKFRSMTDERGEDGELLPGAQRLTPFGKFIRRFSLDELPELFCIFAGKMSIIGPRPLLPEYIPLYTEMQMARHEIKPGLACVSLRLSGTWSWEDQFENDIWYVENVSFLVDLRMIFAVLKVAIAGDAYRVGDVRRAFAGAEDPGSREEGGADFSGDRAQEQKNGDPA